jgi:hypothetical protein
MKNEEWSGEDLGDVIGKKLYTHLCRPTDTHHGHLGDLFENTDAKA